MTLPESEKEKITATIEVITNEFRKTHNVKIHSFYGTDKNLKIIMEDGFVKVGVSYDAQYFETVAYYIMRNYPGDLALYIGIFWKDQLDYLYSFYSEELKKKAMKILDNCVSGYTEN